MTADTSKSSDLHAHPEVGASPAASKDGKDADVVDSRTLAAIRCARRFIIGDPAYEIGQTDARLIHARLSAETARADAAVAEAKALREELEEQKRLPEDVIERLIALGPVEWGASAAQSDEAHCAGLAETLALTRQDFGFEGDRQMHGVFLKGTGIVVCHTGTSPNSAKHAAIIDGALNMLHRLALEHRATLAQPAADGGDNG